MSQFVSGTVSARFFGLDIGDWTVLLGGGCAIGGLLLFLT
jgi:hypothetical protein